MEILLTEKVLTQHTKAVIRILNAGYSDLALKLSEASG
jgi:hypothetical protein